ncbi:hypothetical protein [Streptomyces sp. NPDC047079]|uniref:hypothetical protein n=1 Tax=Streptomyces sp. NPDC047079 TaxID=3154607 RepID=UPI0033E04882
MIRRTLQGGLLAAVAMLSLVPAAAVAADGDRAMSAPVVATVPHRQHTLPAPVRHTPVRHRAPRSLSCHRFIRHGHHVRHAGYACHLRHIPRRAYPHHSGYGTRTAYRHHSYRVVGRVATRHVALNIRSGPGTGYRVVGHRHAQGRLLLVCERHGSYVHGNRHWYRLAGGRGYVSAHYVRTRSAVPWC